MKITKVVVSVTGFNDDDSVDELEVKEFPSLSKGLEEVENLKIKYDDDVDDVVYYITLEIYLGEEIITTLGYWSNTCFMMEEE